MSVAGDVIERGAGADLIERVTQVGERLFAERYAGADSLLLAGSVLRGEGTPHSDLDVVVLFETLPAAYRESFEFEGWPVEAFVHDPQTLKYFIGQLDAPAGVPALACMVVEGVEIPGPTVLSRAMKSFSRASIDDGPPAWSEEDLDRSRYEITDLMDDMRAPRSTAELYATAARLYDRLANHYLRAQRQWSGTGKSIPRRLRQVDPAFAARFEQAFAQVFTGAGSESVIALADSVLAVHGGRLFAGHTAHAPAHWRCSDD